MRHSFGRSEKSAGCENVEIRLVAGVWRKTCGLLLRKESLKRGDYRLLQKEWRGDVVDGWYRLRDSFRLPRKE